MENKQLIEGSPWKGLLKFAGPVFIGLLLQQLYNTVDTIVVGNFESQDALSAVGSAAALTILFLALANGFSAGAGVLVAQLFGAKKEDEMQKSASSSIILMVGMGVVATIAGVLICGFVLETVLTTPTEILNLSILYFRVYSLGLVFQFGYNIISAVLRGVGDSKATMYFLLVAAVINVILDIIFVAVFHWSVMGVAIATNISQACSCIAGVWYMRKKYPIFRWKRQDFIFEKKLAMQTLKIGFPMALQQVIVSLGFVFIQRAVNSYGKLMTASYTVAMKAEMYLNLPASSLQISQATYTGQNLGAGKLERVLKGAKQTIGMSEIITVFMSAAVLVFARQITSIFGLDEAATVYCVAHIRTTAILLFILAGYFPILGLFQGAGNGFKATIVATVALFTRVATTYTLCYLPFMGYRIIWWNTAFGWGIGLIITWTFYLKGGWKKKWVKI